MAKPTQTRIAHSLYLIGASLMAFGLCWGFYVPHTPFPKLALTAHIQCMVEGMMILLSGMLVERTELVMLSEMQAKIVWAGMIGAWPVLMTECANAWWGTNGILPIVSYVSNVYHWITGIAKHLLQRYAREGIRN